MVVGLCSFSEAFVHRVCIDVLQLPEERYGRLREVWEVLLGGFVEGAGGVRGSCPGCFGSYVGSFFGGV